MCCRAGSVLVGGRTPMGPRVARRIWVVCIISIRMLMCACSVVRRSRYRNDHANAVDAQTTYLCGLYRLGVVQCEMNMTRDMQYANSTGAPWRTASAMIGACAADTAAEQSSGARGRSVAGQQPHAEENRRLGNGFRHGSMPVTTTRARRQ